MKLKKLFAMSFAFIITGNLLPISQNISDNVISTAYAEPERMVIYNDEYNSMFEYKSNGQGEIIITKCDTSASGNIDIPDIIDGLPVRYIGKYAFKKCEKITSINIPNSVNTIDYAAFYYCTSLKSVSIGNNVKTIDGFAFAYCRSLEKVVIPNSVNTIDQAAFLDCTSLKSVSIGNNVKTIGSAAFSYCYGLEKVVIPKNVVEIADSAFYHCSELKSIEIRNNPTTIEEFNFAWCINLKNITLPSSVTAIKRYSFFECRSLESLECGENVSEFYLSAIVSCENMKYLTFKNPKCEFILTDGMIDDGETFTPQSINERGMITDKIVIKGYKNSTAETVAKKYGFKFSALPTYGDPTADGKINSVDASEILSIYAKNAQNKSKPSSDDLECCDINKDGVVNAVDASYVLAYYAYSATNKNPVSLTDYMKKK